MNIQETLQLAVSYHQTGRLDDAEPLYRQVIEREPGHPDALHLLGVVQLQRGDRDAGINLVTKAVLARPGVAAYRVTLASALLDAGRPQDALTHAREAAALQSDLTEAHVRVGQACVLLRQFDDAAQAYERAIALDPGFTPAFVFLGHVHLHRGQAREAIEAYERALQLDPDDADTRNSMGHALYEIGEAERGLEAFRRAAQTPLASGAVMSDYGGALRDAGQMTEALAWLRRAIHLQPNLSEIHNNLANVLIQQGRADDAVAELREAIRLLPSNVTAHSNLLFALHLTRESGESIAAEHRAWGERHADPLWRDDVVYSNPPVADRRLRIGYVSPDFRDHPVGRFAWAVLRGHDREAFDVTCYSSLPSPAAADTLTERMRQAVGTWRDVRRLSDAELARQIREDQIDILIDLAGHSAHHRLLAFAQQPAPVQMTWLGYPNTTGMRAIAWRLTDAHADPPGMTEALHTETLLRLPRCAWCFTPPDPSPEPSRAADDRGVTFASFNSLSKLNDDLLRLWAKVLTATSGSRLLLKAAGLEGEQTRQRVLATFNACGVAPERIDLLPPAADFAAHLAIYSHVDVALDAYPYHGTTTTCEALWMGVPVVTLAGRTHVSRVGASLLTNIGLADLVAKDTERYVETATKLAGDRSHLARLRSSLRERMLESPLMDANGFVREFEKAIRSTWMRWCET